MQNLISTSTDSAAGIHADDVLHEPMCLQLAGAAYLVRGMPAEWHSMIPEKLTCHRITEVAANEPVHIINLNVVDEAEHLRPLAESYNLNETTQLNFFPQRIEYDSDWCRGTLHLGQVLSLQLDCHADVESSFPGVLENALRIMVAYDALLNGGLLMHSSAIVIGDNASILFGHSGAGKSTTSQIAMDRGHGVLSDDINVLRCDPEGWQAVRVPFCGTVDGHYQGPGVHPLAGLYRLQKHNDHKIGEYTPAEAVSVVCGSAPFVNQDPYRADQLLDTVERLIGSRPVKKLYFRRDEGFLDLIREDG
jgi:hypothetical protein